MTVWSHDCSVVCAEAGAVHVRWRASGDVRNTEESSRNHAQRKHSKIGIPRIMTSDVSSSFVWLRHIAVIFTITSSREVLRRVVKEPLHAAKSARQTKIHSVPPPPAEPTEQLAAKTVRHSLHSHHQHGYSRAV